MPTWSNYAIIKLLLGSCPSILEKREEGCAIHVYLKAHMHALLCAEELVPGINDRYLGTKAQCAIDSKWAAGSDGSRRASHFCEWGYLETHLLQQATVCKGRNEASKGIYALTLLLRLPNGGM